MNSNTDSQSKEDQNENPSESKPKWKPPVFKTLHTGLTSLNLNFGGDAMMGAS